MPLLEAKKDEKIFLDDDYSYKDVSEDFIGRKAYSLFRLKDMDVPVPPFLALSASVFSEYIAQIVGEGFTKDDTREAIIQKIADGTFPSELKNKIHEGYTRLSGFTDSWVAIRSSIVLPHNQRGLAFAGLLDTRLNAKGIDEVIDAVKKVYASTFSEKVAAYLATHAMSISDIKVGIVIQKMVQAEASGVAFTVDPVSQDENLMAVETVFGLGDVIASGDITPDQYIIDKKTLEFKEKKIVPQEWMMVRKVRHKKGEKAEQKVRISKTWQYQQKLENKYVKDLAKAALIVAEEMGKPQDIEWVYEGGRTWLLQARDQQPVKMPPIDEDLTVKVDQQVLEAAVEIAEREKAKQQVKEDLRQKKESDKRETEEVLVAKPLSRQIVKSAPQIPTGGKPAQPGESIAPLPGEKLLITGVGASQGTFRGHAVVVENKDELKEMRKRIDKDSILVFPEHFPEVDKFVTKVGAVITDTGAVTSDIAILCREKGVPCILGCHIASRMLKNDETLLVDGNIGAIYGIRETIAQPQPRPSREEIMKATTKGTAKLAPEKTPQIQTSTTAEAAKAEAPPQEKITTATKVYVDISADYSRVDSLQAELPLADGVALLQVEDIYNKIGRHPSAFIEEDKQKEFIDQVSAEIAKICKQAEGDPVIVSIGSMSVGQYKQLTKGLAMEKYKEDVDDVTKGLVRLLMRPKELSLFFKIIRNVRNTLGWRNVSIAVEYSGSPQALAEFKKALSSAKLRRSSTFKLFMLVATPSEAMVMEEFVKTGIDGVIIDIRKLATQMMAPKRDDESVLKIVENVRDGAASQTVIIRLPAGTPKIVNKAVKLGVYGLSVDPKDLADVRSEIIKLEQEMVFKDK